MPAPWWRPMCCGREAEAAGPALSRSPGLSLSSAGAAPVLALRRLRPLQLLRFASPPRCGSGPGSPRPALSSVFRLPAPMLTRLRPRRPRWLAGVQTDPSRWPGSAFLPGPGLLAVPPSYAGPRRLPNPIHLLASSWCLIRSTRVRSSPPCGGSSGPHVDFLIS